MESTFTQEELKTAGPWLGGRMRRLSVFYLYMASALDKKDYEQVDTLLEQTKMSICWCDELGFGAPDLGLECKPENCKECLRKILECDC